MTILCPSSGEKFKNLQKFKKLTKTLCHEHTHAIKKKLLNRAGESLGADGEDRGDVSSTLKGLLKMSSPVFMDEVKRDVLQERIPRWWLEGGGRK
jgi:hypothetical protein